jgi:1,4-dihydroxy-2-naphthoate octaprenyltransferase
VKLHAWVLASRPATLAAAAVPVVVGTACAHAAGGARPLVALAALVSATFIQVGTNFANDVFDYEKGADHAGRLGPLRVTQAGLLSPADVRRGMWVAFVLATLVGAYLIALRGWPVLAIGLASIAAGIAYTGGPFPLGYNGLGDLFVMIFFGFVAVCGTAYAHLGRVPALAWWAAVPVGALITAILVVNNIRDVATDRAAGKRTLAVRLGAGAARAEYVLLVAVAYAVPVALWARGLASAWVFVTAASLALAAPLAWRVMRGEGEALNRALKGTARLSLVYSLLFAVGIVAGAV